MERKLSTSDFDFGLPEDRIATHPAHPRDASRLLVMDRDTGNRLHATFRDILMFLRPRSLLVLNDTRVIAARLVGKKETGGAAEILLVRPQPALPSDAPGTERWQVLAKNLASLRTGAQLTFPEGLVGNLAERGERGAAVISFLAPPGRSVLAVADRHGRIPLPPYIEAARRRDAGPNAVPRADVSTAADREQYQTVFARALGAVAAPTAGLHFTPELLTALQEAGHELTFVTLHVGPGTFRSVETEDPEQHQVDAETFEVSPSAVERINAARAQGRPIVAVGTTSVRVLETLAETGDPFVAGGGSTQLFLRPGRPFRLVTDLITNFHLPRSSLLMLVAAFAGLEHVRAAYDDAIARAYRFYSYGDAMFIRPGPLPSGSKEPPAP